MKSANPPASRLLSAHNAATYLDMPYTSLRNAAKNGHIRVVLLGKRWYFRREDLDRWVDQETRPAWMSDERPRKAKPQIHAA